VKNNCTVIIPSISLNKEVKTCIDSCLNQKDIKITIYLVTDNIVKKKYLPNKVKYLSFGNINMSEKRNRAVKLCKDKYIAFIDSDAAATNDWVKNGINILKNNKNIAIVTGPDLPFPDQKGWSKIIGLAHKSFLLSGSKVFRKNISKKIFCSQASSCNMILFKKYFLKVNGMNDKIYIGEDIDLCDKIIKIKKIVYSPIVKIFHRNRDFIPFIFQRYAYGTSVEHVFSRGVFINNIQYFIPFFIFIYFIIFPYMYFFNVFFDIYALSIISFNILVFFETFKLSKNPIEIIKLNIIIYLSIFSFGFGSLMKFLGFAKNIKKKYIYRSKLK
jgi:glycosyltransferase involved in cell wall biosynthesis